MKKKICLLFIGLFFLCSGCSATYTLTINEDFTVDEEVTALEDAEFYSNYSNSSVQKVIGFLLEPNLDYFNENGFTISNILNSQEAGVKITNTYTNLEEYKNKSQFFQQIADDWTYTENGDEITLTITGAFSQEEQNQDGRYVVSDAKINIVVPFEVLNHNADSYDATTHTYTWNFDENTTDKEITITFNKTIDKPFDMTLIVIGIMIVIALITVIVIFKFIDVNKDRNQIE